MRDVTKAPSGLGVNMEHFESDIESAAFTGVEMFRAAARLKAPEGLPLDELRQALGRLASEIMVDLAVARRRSVADVSSKRIQNRLPLALSASLTIALRASSSRPCPVSKSFLYRNGKREEDRQRCRVRREGSYGPFIAWTRTNSMRDERV